LCYSFYFSGGRVTTANKLIEALSIQAPAELDSEVRFRALAVYDNIKKGLKLLDKLDAHFSK